MIEEKRIIKLLKEKNREGLRILYNMKYKKIFKIAYGYTNIKEEAEDILQETFVRVYQKIDRFNYNGKNSLDKWVVRICINLSLDYLRKKKAEKIFLFNRFTEKNRYLLPHDEKKSLYNSTKDIEKALSSLSAKQRVVFSLKYIEGFSVMDIAKILNCSPNTVKKHIYRSLVKLRRYYGGKDEKS